MMPKRLDEKPQRRCNKTMTSTREPEVDKIASLVSVIVMVELLAIISNDVRFCLSRTVAGAPTPVADELAPLLQGLACLSGLMLHDCGLWNTGCEKSTVFVGWDSILRGGKLNAP
ncbi:hypothetical protein EGW08_020912 [Elysia chlorotica]|uniref:Uncharacterized protein n=1 Tax=Elysia chlorotica TaxID=188477 RepID=A0A433SPY6_ELYCH|nr:hypothetical protein EGW08_020912 [Elysia chlorotica]